MSPTLSRRAVTLALAAMPAATTAIASEPDPIFAAIDVHRRAYVALEQVCKDEPDDDTPEKATWEAPYGEAADAEWNASWALLDPGPKTVAGVAALLAYMAEIWDARYEWPERKAE